MQIKWLFAVVIAWTFGLLMLGAYVRLSDAGLGCPDWPGCYGQLTAPDEAHEIHQAQQQFGGEIVPHKGWKEMIHRYAAGILGVLVLALTVVLWRQRQRLGLAPWLIVLPLVVVVFQALLGMWTVTLKLMPGVVTAHLIGGMTLLALLIALAARYLGRPISVLANLRPWFFVALLAVIVQIIIGGWVSTNYAGLACNDFPLCQGQITAPQGLLAALRPDRELGRDVAGELLTIEHLAAIHWLHRVGAMLVLALVGVLIYRLRNVQPRLAWALAGALLLQVSLGIANVLASLPLSLAVAHNGGAALLLGILIYGLTLTPRSARSNQSAPHFQPEIARSTP
ncbi:COX15/CtaA family protein [Deefgea rivuli]|uniref:COX15/CtaA family protein n=1 Tax=Deefgea rivuli TaxID=400948 RepID=UPI0009FBFB75|nr:COX15/CtaA family protein [Deefgea rivuli]